MSLPPLPKIEGDLDLVLDVYTHSSLRFDNAPMNDEYGDTDRLAVLGARILDLTITYHYYSKKPMLSADDIDKKREAATSNQNLERWLEAYGLRQKLRFAPGSQDAIGTPEEIKHFFHTYIGALHIRNGTPTVQDWISRLIEPDLQHTIGDTQTQYSGYPGQPAPPYPGQSWSSPAPPAGPPPPLPGFSPNTPMNNGSISNLVSLALVNQTAVQRGFHVTYPAEQVGPPHQPIWTVRCCMNGEEQGRGSGKSQKVAKEEAARQAWVNMGWGPHA